MRDRTLVLHQAAPDLRDAFTGLALGALAHAILWHGRARQRRDLAALTPEQLHDIGVDGIEVRREAAKPFWRA